MLINLSPSSTIPAYEQIFIEIKRLILNGDLKKDEILPSIRALAKQVSCSVITIRKSYDKLENEGLIYTKAGKGCFVSNLSQEKIEMSKQKQLFKAIDELIVVADNLGFKKEKLPTLVKERIKNGK